MIEGNEWASGIVGLIVFALGLIPILETFKVLNLGLSKMMSASWFSAIVPYLLAILGLFLLIDSVQELMNSNPIGWVSFGIGALIMAIGILITLKAFGIGPGLFGLTLSPMLYSIIFMVEGLFLMIAMFAMGLF